VKGWRHFSEVSERNSIRARAGLAETKRQKPRIGDGAFAKLRQTQSALGGTGGACRYLKLDSWLGCSKNLQRQERQLARLSRNGRAERKPCQPAPLTYGSCSLAVVVEGSKSFDSVADVLGAALRGRKRRR
jgi:hypothetical protein